MVEGTKKALQEYRATGFASLLKNVTMFCGKHDIKIVYMGDFHQEAEGIELQINIILRLIYSTLLLICKFKSLDIVLVREAPFYL